MAHICYLPKGNCTKCRYFRKDEDGRLCCFATHDITALEKKDSPYIVTVTRDGVEIGSMEIDEENVNWTDNEFSSVIQTASAATEEE